MGERLVRGLPQEAAVGPDEAAHEDRRRQIGQALFLEGFQVADPHPGGARHVLQRAALGLAERAEVTAERGRRVFRGRHAQ